MAVKAEQDLQFNNIQVDGYSDLQEIAAPATPAAGFVRVYPKTDGKLYIKDDAGTETDLTASGGGGSTVPAWLEHLAVDGTEAEGQEFTGTIGGTVVEPSGTTTWTQDRGVLSVNYHSQASADLAGRMYPLVGTWQVGSYIEAALRLGGTQDFFTMAGLVVSDDGGGALGASNGAVFPEVHIDGNSPTIFAITRRGTFSDISSGHNTGARFVGQMPLVYIRTTMVSAGTWRTEYSADGLSWTVLGLSDLTGGISDVTHYGAGVTRWGGGADESVAAFEYIRAFNLA